MPPFPLDENLQSFIRLAGQKSKKRFLDLATEKTKDYREDGIQKKIISAKVLDSTNNMTVLLYNSKIDEGSEFQIGLTYYRDENQVEGYSETPLTIWGTDDNSLRDGYAKMVDSLDAFDQNSETILKSIPQSPRSIPRNDPGVIRSTSDSGEVTFSFGTEVTLYTGLPDSGKTDFRLEYRWIQTKERRLAIDICFDYLDKIFAYYDNKGKQGIAGWMNVMRGDPKPFIGMEDEDGSREATVSVALHDGEDESATIWGTMQNYIDAGCPFNAEELPTIYTNTLSKLWGHLIEHGANYHIRGLENDKLELKVDVSHRSYPILIVTGRRGNQNIVSRMKLVYTCIITKDALLRAELVPPSNGQYYTGSTID